MQHAPPQTEGPPACNGHGSSIFVAPLHDASMATISCPGCGKTVSDETPYCPNCRHPVLEMRPRRPDVEVVEERVGLPWPYRVALLLGAIAFGTGGLIGRGWLFALGAAGLLVGAYGVVVFTFGKRGRVEDDFDED